MADNTSTLTAAPRVGGASAVFGSVDLPLVEVG
jgi:hypothetical protein